MSTPNSNAYGNTSNSEPSFRRTWDRAEYTAKAEAREAKIKEEAKARYEAKLEGKKYIPQASTPQDQKFTEARTERLDVSANVGKTFLVPAGAATGKRGRGAGQYCEACDLTFKDNIQWVEHLNSRQHLQNTGQSGEVKHATLEEVRERLAWLHRRKEEEKQHEEIDLGKRLEARKNAEEAEREEKRRKRNEKRRKTKDGAGVKMEEEERGGIIC